MALPEIARVLFALAVVLTMLGLGAYASRRLGVSAIGGGLARRKRLALVEVLPIDSKRRAAIIRCDGAEHLVVLNPNSVTVVARHVERAEEGPAVEDPATDTAGERTSERPAGAAFAATFARMARAAGKTETPNGSAEPVQTAAEPASRNDAAA